MGKSVVRIGRGGKGVESGAGQCHASPRAHAPELDTRVELIQALIPIGLEAENELLQQEVCQLSGRPLQPCGRPARACPLGISTWPANSRRRP